MWKLVSLCIVLTWCRDVRGNISGQMAEITQKCCDDGSAHARSHDEGCNIPTAPADVPAAFGALCVMAQAQCCREYYKKKDSCDSGLDLALSTGKCKGSKDFTKVCCDECSRGSAAGLAGGAEACVSKAHAGSAEGLLADDAYLKCCMKTAKDGPPKITSKPEVLASVCEDYAPNELCAHHCIPIPGSYKCDCNPGFMLMADGRNCREVVKNRCKPRNPCEHKCNDNGVDVLCSCRRGYELMPDGKSCQDIDECQLDIPVCLAGTECHNIQGSYRCINQKKSIPIRGNSKGQCPPGFARNLKNNVCDDINECKLPRPPCPAYLCQNTVGGYKCGGVVGDPMNLTPRSTDVEDRCPPGFALGSSGECEDVDECAIMTDDCNRLSQYCVNTHSSFYCQDMVSKLCQPGFKIDAMTNRCEDINECEDHAICKSDQICVNQPGQYVCKQKPSQVRPSNGECPEGMRIDPVTHICEDIDECVEGTHLCDQHQNCVNTIGNYQCDCKHGFELDTTTGACVDVNECATHQHDCISNSQRCDNTIGSYLCIRITSCGTGYILQHSTGKCEDNDECALGTHNCAIAGPEYQCMNIPGSFRCVRKRASTTTTTAAPEYEYEYYDSDEEIDTPSTNKTDSAPAASSSPAPSNPPSSTEVAPPPDRRPKDQTPEVPKREEQTDKGNKMPTNEERKPIDHVPEVPRYIAPLYTPETTASPEPTPEITYSKPDTRNRPEIVYEPNSEPPERNTPDSTYYETKPDKPISSNEISPEEKPRETEIATEREIERQTETVTEQIPPRRPKGSVQTYSPYRPTSEFPRPVTSKYAPPRPVYEEQTTIKSSINVNDCPTGYEVDSNGGCFDIDECTTNRHSCSGLTETCRNSVGGYVCDCAFGFRRDLTSSACVPVITTSSTTSTTKELPPPPSLPTLPPILLTLPPTPPTQPTLPPTPPTLPQTPPTLPPTTSTLPPTTPTLPPTTTPEPVSSTTQKARELFFGYRDDRPQYTRPFRPRSSCDAGYYLNAQTSKCEDIDECTNGQANCAAVEICVNTRGGYRCECPPNWRLDDVRHRCIPVRSKGLFPPGYGNEPEFPADPQESVGHGFESTNVVNPDFTQVGDRGTVLKCPWGYRLGDDNNCVDVDECATDEAKCGIQQLCINLAGGYTCSCPRGHRLVGDHECEDVDECALAGNTSICSRNADCVNTIGSYRCMCHTGFRPAPVNDKVCVDVDECSESRPGSLCQHRCNNVWGSYGCSCHRGYRLSADNRTCVDVDECVEYKSKVCVGKCLNEPGSYRCACPIGYRLSEDKKSCIDIDECETGEASCQTGVLGGTSHVCSNTRGSYHCQQISCPQGYKLEGKHRCTKTQRVCMAGDWECAHQATTISYNFITFVSNLFVPVDNVKLFTMRGPAWPFTELTFQLRLVNVNAPPSVKDRADINAFLLTQSGHEAVISLVRPLEGPQSIELELSMELHNREQFGGIAIAKVFIYVSEYEF